jgi:F-type H+-transporting ATPase subunit epsilon
MVKVSLVTPQETLFEGLAESVFLPGEYGEFEVLAYHNPIVSTLTKGVVRIDERLFQISHGIARLNENNDLIILADG